MDYASVFKRPLDALHGPFCQMRGLFNYTWYSLMLSFNHTIVEIDRETGKVVDRYTIKEAEMRESARESIERETELQRNVNAMMQVYDKTVADPSHRTSFEVGVRKFYHELYNDEDD
ncbi:MAG: hypothetical protein V1836_04010 [Candidatus Aenigmatarchaeota archaeon]